MFTGLVEEIGTVMEVRRQSDGIIFAVGAEVVLEGTEIGHSIAVHGVCLTVTEIGRKSFSAFASKVTCETTTLGRFTKNKCVHLERAMRLDSRLGGHLVQGHVDGKAVVSSLRRDSGGLEMEISISDDLRRYLVQRGSVAVDGVSLTVVSLNEKSFNLYLIPETLKSTTFASLSPGDEVNIETDILAKYVERMLSNKGQSDDRSLMRKLEEGGFF